MEREQEEGDRMTGQMSIFDFLCPGKIDPIKEVAKMAGPHWTDSKEKLIKLLNKDPGIDRWSRAVRHEFCPYGGAGHYSHIDKPNTLQSYDMRTASIKVEYTDSAGERIEQIYSWNDFAREIADMIWRGEWEI